jgi:tetratricopeptide (TPR) repeat protein
VFVGADAAAGRVAKPTYYIPFLKNPYFVGRRDELNVLQQKLLVDQDCQKMSMAGLGGTGKTQVALQFAYTVKEAWPEYSIFWVPALSMESFEQACAGIARALRMPQGADREGDAKELVKQWLSSSRAGRWLLVVDNADDPDILFGIEQSKGIVDYLPESEKGVVMYTTRTLQVAVSLTRSDVLQLGAMDRQDAADFLTKSLINKDLLRNNETINTLLDELTCLPLAIAQAAAYFNMNQMPITKYLQLLRSTEQNIVSLMSKEFRDDTRCKEAANAVATTWVVSFSQVRERDAVAADLLVFMSCVEWKAIPRSLLPKEQPEGRMEEAIGTLCGYSFLARRGDDNGEDSNGEVGTNSKEKTEEEVEWYDIHRLVHLATRIWVRKYGNAAEVIEEAVQHVAKIFPSDDYANCTVWRAYLPHALRLLGSRQECNVQEKAELCLLVGRCLRVDGRIREAVTWLEACCRWRYGLDENNSDRLLSQHVLAMAYRADGQVKKAVELLEHVVAVRKKVQAEEHLDRLASQHMLAGAYEADGQVKKAVELLEHVVAVRKKVLAEEHPDRLASQHELARAYQADGQVKKAVELLEHVVAVRQKVQTEGHPSRLASQHVLAMAYRADGQAKKAVELLEHVVAVRKVQAEEHPDRLASQHVLAMAYQADGQVKKAVELLEHVVAVRQKVQAEEHPDRLASQHELARAYQADGQVKKAVKLLEHVVATKARTFGEDHPLRFVSLEVLIDLYDEL